MISKIAARLRDWWATFGGDADLEPVPCAHQIINANTDLRYGNETSSYEAHESDGRAKSTGAEASDGQNRNEQ